MAEPVKIVFSKSGMDVDPDQEKRLKELMAGAEPITDEEKAIVEKMEEIKKKGWIIEIPGSEKS